MSIRLSRKHGLNPTVAVCWYCGKAKNEVVLLGAAGDKIAKELGRPDGDMPMHTCLDRVPCDECKGFMERGIMLLEVTDAADPLSEDPPRTGRMWVVSIDAVQRWFKPSMAAELVKARRAFIPESAAKQIGLPDQVHDVSDVPKGVS